MRTFEPNAISKCVSAVVRRRSRFLAVIPSGDREGSTNHPATTTKAGFVVARLGFTLDQNSCLIDANLAPATVAPTTTIPGKSVTFSIGTESRGLVNITGGGTMAITLPGSTAARVTKTGRLVCAPLAP